MSTAGDVACKRYREKYPDRPKAARKRYELSHPEAKKAKRHRYQIARLAREPNWYKQRRLRVEHRLSLEEYNAILAEQDGRCALCGGKPNGRWGTLNIDHNHKTGERRGLICDSCNRGLGLFGDNEVLLRKAAEYLEKYVNL
jgi:hypothetical protein